MAWDSVDEANSDLAKIDMELRLLRDMDMMVATLPLHYSRRRAALKEQRGHVLLWLLVHELQAGK